MNMIPLVKLISTSNICMISIFGISWRMLRISIVLRQMHYIRFYSENVIFSLHIHVRTTVDFTFQLVSYSVI